LALALSLSLSLLGLLFPSDFIKSRCCRGSYCCCSGKRGIGEPLSLPVVHLSCHDFSFSSSSVHSRNGITGRRNRCASTRIKRRKEKPSEVLYYSLPQHQQQQQKQSQRAGGGSFETTFWSFSADLCSSFSFPVDKITNDLTTNDPY